MCTHAYIRTCPASWCWLAPVSPVSGVTGCHHHTLSPIPKLLPGHFLFLEEARPTDTTHTHTNKQNLKMQFSVDAWIVFVLHLWVCTCLCRVRESISDKTQPTLPSPPHTRIRNVSNFWNKRKLQHKNTIIILRSFFYHPNVCICVSVSYPRCGPPFIRSKTCAGFNSCLNRRRNFTPWLSPLLLLTKTNNGLVHVGGHDAFQNPACDVTFVLKHQIYAALNFYCTSALIGCSPSESMLLRAVGGITDTLHWPSGHLMDSCSLHPACTWRTITVKCCLKHAFI